MKQTDEIATLVKRVNAGDILAAELLYERSTYEYTKIGATLLAYIIEVVSEKRFDDYVQQKILEPLEMNESTWSWAKSDKEHQASLYLSSGILIPHYDLITYPDGGLITSVNDFTIYLQEMIKGMNGESKLLKQELYNEMMSNQLTKENFPDGEFVSPKGLLWYSNKEGDNISANGADPGIMTYTMFTTAGNIGIVFFTNTSLYGNEKMEGDFTTVRNMLMHFAGKIQR